MAPAMLMCVVVCVLVYGLMCVTAWWRLVCGCDEVALALSKKRKKGHEQKPVADLPDDVLIVILSRVRYRSLCRFKCVSKQWLALCSELDVLHRRSPRTLSGLYYFADDRDGLSFHHLTMGVPPVVDPNLSFLRGSYQRITAEECCGSLLLCACWKPYSQRDEYDYVVCNPATEKWTVLPPMEFPDEADGHRLIRAELYLALDAVNPSSFVVVETVTNYIHQIRELAVYSSETGRWTSMKSEWGPRTIVPGYADFIYLNGTVHFGTLNSSIVTLHIEGRIWKEIEMPHMACSIGQSLGCLHAWHLNNSPDCQLSVWVLEDYDRGNWTLKHTVNVLGLFGRHCRKDETYEMMAIHPKYNLIFLTDEEITISYDMDNQKVHVISTSKEHECCVPYIPCFAKWLSVGR
ncbi:putative F-box protein At3g52320 [Aegilops tauschii subsp. strangulata]|uniref:putative F-box protein At3g52320 n=1 Tax=Aegilops tauschii subsp. strangulata TaxID=200361 RepID=UPI003CC89543